MTLPGLGLVHVEAGRIVARVGVHCATVVRLGEDEKAAEEDAVAEKELKRLAESSDSELDVILVSTNSNSLKHTLRVAKKQQQEARRKSLRRNNHTNGVLLAKAPASPADTDLTAGKSLQDQRTSRSSIHHHIRPRLRSRSSVGECHPEVRILSVGDLKQPVKRQFSIPELMLRRHNGSNMPLAHTTTVVGVTSTHPGSVHSASPRAKYTFIDWEASAQLSLGDAATDWAAEMGEGGQLDIVTHPVDFEGLEETAV